MSRWRGARSVTSRPPIAISPARHLLEAGDRAQQRRLAAARRPDERDELAVPDVERDVVDGDDVAREDLRDASKLDLGHGAGYGYHISSQLVLTTERSSVDSRDGRRRARSPKPAATRTRATSRCADVEARRAHERRGRDCAGRRRRGSGRRSPAAIDAIAERLRVGRASRLRRRRLVRPHRRARRRRVRGDLLHPARPRRRRSSPAARLRAPLAQAAAEDDRDAGAATISGSGVGPDDASSASARAAPPRTSLGALETAARGRGAHGLRRLGAELRARRARRARDRGRRRARSSSPARRGSRPEPPRSSSSTRSRRSR